MPKRNATLYVTPPNRATRRRLSFGAAYSTGKTGGSLTFGYDDASSEGLRATSITGGPDGKTAGFISTKLSAKRSLDKFHTKGLVAALETGGIVDGGSATSSLGNTVAVGHCTMPALLVSQMLWRAIVKQILIRMGQTNMTLWTSSFGGLISDQIEIVYKASAGDSDNVGTVTYTFAGTSADTPEAIASYFHTQFLTLYSPILEILRCRFIPTANSPFRAVWMKLTNLNMHLYSKSSLKVQNQTVGSTTGDEESVNNVPLNGKAYYCKGSRADPQNAEYKNLLTNPGAGFSCSDEYGHLAKVPSEAWYQEPVNPQHFGNVKGFGKVVINPGHVKTSVLTDSGVFTIAFLMRNVLTPNVNSGTHTRVNVGTMRFMILEKMLTCAAASAENAIKLGFEVQIQMGAYVTFSNNTYTATLPKVQNIQNTA